MYLQLFLTWFNDGNDLGQLWVIDDWFGTKDIWVIEGLVEAESRHWKKCNVEKLLLPALIVYNGN